MRVVIRQKSGYATREGLVFEVGDVADLDDHLAAKLIQYGIAAPAPAPKPVIEAAVKAPPQNAAKHISKPKPKASKRSTPAKEEAE